MCCDEKFLFFINMRLCSLIFGWIFVVLTGLLTLALFILEVICLNNLFTENGPSGFGIVVAVLVIAWILVHVATGFTATVFLLVGIFKNKPGFLKGYLIYGMVHLSLFIIQQIILDAMGTISFPAIRIATAIGIGFYLSILTVLFKTYNSMVAPNVFYNPPQQV